MKYIQIYLWIKPYTWAIDGNPVSFLLPSGAPGCYHSDVFEHFFVKDLNRIDLVVTSTI